MRHPVTNRGRRVGAATWGLLATLHFALGTASTPAQNQGRREQLESQQKKMLEASAAHYVHNAKRYQRDLKPQED